LKNVITGDMTWVYSYDIDNKQQSSHWKSPTSPRPKKSMTGVLASESNAAFF
jgi:hypothetical protein